MQSIFVGSTGNEPGQTLAAWALASRLKEKGLKVGFFKPYGLLPNREPSAGEFLYDPDVLLLKEVLGLTEGEETLCPVMLTDNIIPEVTGSKGEELLRRIDEAFQETSRGKDVVLIMGAKEIFFGGELSTLSDSTLVKRFHSSVLLVDRYQRDNLTLYSILSLNSFLEGRVKSVIINHIPPDKMEHVKNKVIPFLREKGLRTAVGIPEDPLLAAFTVAGIAEWVNGRILCCPEGAGNLIATFTIGARSLGGPLSLFKQIYNKVILVGLQKGEGDQISVGGIILTGGKAPSEIILRIAREQSIPLIQTRGDTFQTMERLEKARPSLRLHDSFKVRQFLNLIHRDEEARDWAEALL
jgi:BioD-like phosphotransacetylase family protein